MNFESLSSLFGIQSAKIYKKTNKHHSIETADNQWIVYNTMLNMPIFMGIKEKEWLDANHSIDKAFFEKQNAETKIFIENLLKAYLYFPDEMCEKHIVAKRNMQHLQKFSKGEVFEWLDLRISEACNFGCPHCIANKADKHSMMDSETAIALTQKYIDFIAPLEVISIHFGNREPLLNYCAIKNVIEYVKEKYPNVQKEFSINTNLSLITPEMAQYFIDNDVRLYISLDGPKQANDSIRIYKDKSGTYDSIIKKMDLLEGLGRRIDGISVTVTDGNFKMIDENFLKWCVDKKFTSVALDFDLVNSMGLSVKTKAEFLRDAWIYFTKHNVEFYGTWMTPVINLSNKSCANEAFAFCKASEGKNISVNKNGEIGACSYSSKTLATFDTIYDDIKENGKYYNFVSDRLSNNVHKSECKSCVLQGACCGQCEMSRTFLSKELLDKQCEFYRLVTEYILIEQAKILTKGGFDNECN